MILNQKIAQKLVDNIMKNLGYNINIMNESGIIIASGNKERIGTYHKIADEVITNKKRIDIQKEEENIYNGVKEGINMPFYYKSQIAGVIGITGNPKEIENAAEMVRMATEVMLEQEFLKERIYSHQSQKSFFINKLLHIYNEDEAMEVMQWGLRLGYDLKIPRVVCIMSIKNLKELTETNPLYTSEKIKEITLQNIKNSQYHSKQDISSYINIDDIIIFKVVSTKEKSNYRETISTYLQKVCTGLERQIGVKWVVGVGTYYQNIFDLRKSFNEAQTMLKYANIQEYNKVYFTEDYVFHYLLSLVPKEEMEHFIRNKYEEIKDKEDIIQTIFSLVENNMSLKTAADALYVHRNTIIFRMKKIKDLLGIDPLQKEEDRIMMHLLYHYIKIYKDKF